MLYQHHGMLQSMQVPVPRILPGFDGSKCEPSARMGSMRIFCCDLHRLPCRFLYLISYQVSMGSINEWLEMPKYFAIPR